MTLNVQWDGFKNSKIDLELNLGHSRGRATCTVQNELIIMRKNKHNHIEY